MADQTLRVLASQPSGSTGSSLGEKRLECSVITARASNRPTGAVEAVSAKARGDEESQAQRAGKDEQPPGGTGYGPPLVNRKPVPSIPESSGPGRSRSFSFGRRPSMSGGSPKSNKLIKPSPRQVPLPGSLRDPSVRDPSIAG
ncbi:hypothetical protein FRC07_001881 [Ceratobasidium sp. 392]|nr:hypothetical protein FRC07_001881 [Ceratobasidium sp. 392]